MGLNLRRFVWLLFLFLLTGSGVSYGLLKKKVTGADFKAFAEQKVGEFLQAKVRIGEIKIGSLNEINLNGLEIRTDQPLASPYVRVEKVVFRYHWLQILTQNFKVPAAIILSAPSLFWKEGRFPYQLFREINFGSGGSSIQGLELDGGEISIPISGLDEPVVLGNIQGSFRPKSRNRIDCDFKASMSGFFSGELEVRGEVDPFGQKHRLNLQLTSGSFQSSVPSPLDSVTGKFRWVNGNLYFDEMKIAVHGWMTRLRGAVLRVNSDPVIILDWNLGKKASLTSFQIRSDLAKGTVKGHVRPFGKREWPFEGRIRKDRSKLYLNDFLVDHRFRGAGEADFQSGQAQFGFEKGVQRIFVHTNTRDLNFRLRFLLDHVKVYGLDLTTLAELKLTALPNRRDRGPKFHGNFETEYFILEYAPFQEFKGDFEVDSSGVKNFSSSWGQVFRMEGSASFEEARPDLNLVVRMNGIDLKAIQEFAAKPVRKDLGGILEGKLKLQGPTSRPEMIGHFSIKNGRIGRLEFDRGIIRFQGFPPYLPLSDSHVLKGRTSLQLNGALDLSLTNMFQGIQIVTHDNIVVWKGVEVHAGSPDGEFEIRQKFIHNLPPLTLKSQGPGVSSPTDPEAPPSEERYFAVGPKFKF